METDLEYIAHKNEKGTNWVVGAGLPHRRMTTNTNLRSHHV